MWFVKAPCNLRHNNNNNIQEERALIDSGRYSNSGIRSKLKNVALAWVFITATFL